MQALEDAVTLQRGAGIRVWLFFQSMAQLKKCFGDNADTVLDNLNSQQYMSINSYATADEISKRMGEATVAVRSGGGSSGSSWPVGASLNNPRSRNSGSSFNTSEAARRLLKPEEVLCLDEEVVLIFHKNLPVIPARRIRYYRDKAFRRGGTGKSRGLGLGGALAACSALLVTFICSLPLLALDTAREAGTMPEPSIAPAHADVRRLRPMIVIEGEPPPLRSRDASSLNPATVPPSFTPSRPVVRPLAPLGRRRPPPYGGLNHGQED